MFDLSACESKDSNSLRLHPFISSRIIMFCFGRQVTSAVNFNNQLRCDTVKVGSVDSLVLVSHETRTMGCSRRNFSLLRWRFLNSCHISPSYSSDICRRNRENSTGLIGLVTWIFPLTPSDSPGSYRPTVANAKTANPKIELKQSTSVIRADWKPVRQKKTGSLVVDLVC